MDNKLLEWIYSLERDKVTLGLERVESILKKLGNPEKNLKYIHVTGTNGKGSVCAMIASVLQAQGYKVGLYTSPHLKKFNERIKINGKDISDERLSELVEKAKMIYTNQSFFELTTAMAFLYYFEEKVDYVVLEVGLGGRLDATNVIIPLVSVITNVGLEHCEILGNTIEKIAFEKAGIIKKNVPVVTLADGSALDVIKKVAKEKNASVTVPEFRVRNEKLSISSHKDLELGLKGDFQFSNAALAVATIEVLGKQGVIISDDSIHNGLNNTVWRGRLEFIEKNVLIDSAHNPSGIAVLKNEIMKIKKNYEKVISVVGILKDKEKDIMLKDISSFSDYIVFTKAPTERGTDPKELASLVSVSNEIVNDPKKALKRAKKLANPYDLVVVCGSIYVVGEIV